jgi:ankyrin repeat protein
MSIIKAFTEKHQKQDAEKLRARTAALRLRSIRRSRGLSYRAGGKLSSVGAEPATGKQALIDKDALTLRALMESKPIALTDFIKGGGDPEYSDSDGFPLLHLSVGANNCPVNPDCVKSILIWQPELDRKIHGNRPLNYSAAFGTSESSRLLLEAGCNTGENKSVSLVDPLGRTPLLTVMMRDPFDREHFNVLLKHFPGAARIADYNGMTCLMRAVELKNDELVRVLLDVKKINRDYKDKLGRTVLMMAAASIQFNVCLMLLDPPGPDQSSRTTKDVNGWNARKYAIHLGGAIPSLVKLMDPKFDVPLQLLKKRKINRGRRFNTSSW